MTDLERVGRAARQVALQYDCAGTETSTAIADAFKEFADIIDPYRDPYDYSYDG